MLGDGVKAAREAMDDPRVFMLPMRFRAAFSLLLDDVQHIQEAIGEKRDEGWSGAAKNPDYRGWYLCRRWDNRWSGGCRWRFWFDRRWWRVDGGVGYPVHDAFSVGGYDFRVDSRKESCEEVADSFVLHYSDLKLGRRGDL